MRLTFFLSDRLPDISSNGSLSVTPWLEYTPCLQGCSMQWAKSEELSIWFWFLAIMFMFPFHTNLAIFEKIYCIYCYCLLWCIFVLQICMLPNWWVRRIHSKFKLFFVYVYCILYMYMFTVHFTERGLKLLQILSTIVSKITRDLPV